MLIQNQIFDEERALYNSRDIIVSNCRFDGPGDGESALKESRNVVVENTFCNLRYPFWHNYNLEIKNTSMTTLCRAALWYSEDVVITDSSLHGIKAVRECKNITLKNCDVDSTEFGWYSQGIHMEDTGAKGEYFLMQTKDVTARNLSLDGKYSFQYMQDAVIEDSTLNTKDAFWHAKNVLVRNCTVRGEYLAWYCENVTFENCIIIGTQPLCYCKGLKLIHCIMRETDLSFEKSEVEAELIEPILSIKNPRSGIIRVPAVREVILDDEEAKGEIVLTQGNDTL